MPAPSPPTPSRRRRSGWLAGPLVALLLAGTGSLLGAAGTAGTAGTLPVSNATAYLPADATRGKVTLRVGDSEAPAELADARLGARVVPAGFSPTAYTAIDPAVRDRPGATWYREAVVPAGGTLAPRYRLRTVDERGVWLVAQDWGGRGLVLDGFLDLPADVAVGRSWTSSGTARRAPADGGVPFTDRSTASTPADPGRAAEGCLSVDSRTALGGPDARTWTETRLWCPGKGVVSGQGDLDGTGYAVGSGGAPSPVTDADLAAPAWDPAGASTWRWRTARLVAGDATFGLVDAGRTGQTDPESPPVVSGSGAVTLTTPGGLDLTGLVPRQDGLWAHWWARPGGQITTLAATGSLVVAPTTAHRVSAYRAGRTFAWSAPLDDVAVAPPLPVGDAVAVATVSGTLSLLDLRTGAVRWSVRVGGGVHTALAAGSDVVVTADTRRTVTAWDLRTGAWRWQVADIAEPSFGTVLVADGRVVVVNGGLLTGYDAASGRRAWTREAGLDTGAVTVVGDQLWLDVGDGLQAWSAVDGRTRWRAEGTASLSTTTSGCTDPSGAGLGLVRRGRQVALVDAGGTVRAAWALPVPVDQVLTVTCRGAGVDLTAYASDGSVPLSVHRLAGP